MEYKVIGKNEIVWSIVTNNRVFPIKVNIGQNNYRSMHFPNSPIIKDEHVKYLKKHGFLPESISLDEISTDLNKHKVWADVFWRRRKNHSRRTDPEVDIIIDMSFESLLEIGIAYGRVMKKILEKLANSTEGELESDVLQVPGRYVGIELCPHFEKYVDQYGGLHPLLKHVDFVFDDFLTTTSLNGDTFDVILLPMNTLPSLSPSFLDKFLSTVQKYLAKDGTFIFTTYANPDDIIKSSWRSSYSGELAVEWGASDRIAAEFYTFEGEPTEFGMFVPTFMKYNVLSAGYELQETLYFRTARYILSESYLKNIIEANGFTITLEETIGHSLVLGLQL